jgi:hypothetical protein
MNTRAIVGVLVLLAFIAFGATLYYSFSQKEEENTAPVVEEPVTGYLPEVVNALHQFKGGTHTIAGEVDVPTPCDLLEAEGAVEVREPREDKATIQFTTVNEADVCAQVVTPARFKVSFTAGEEAEIVGTWNGRPVKLNLVEVGPNDNIDDFDVYFKG